MSRQLAALMVASGLLLAGCATVSDTIDSINPFASAGPKMAPLGPLTATADVRTAWSASAGKAGDYTFTPAVVGSAVFVASRSGTVSKLEDGKLVWKIDAGQPLSAGVGASGRLLVVGTSKGEVLAFSTENGKALWQAKVSSEVLAAPVAGASGFINARRPRCRCVVLVRRCLRIAISLSGTPVASSSLSRFKMVPQFGRALSPCPRVQPNLTAWQT